MTEIDLQICSFQIDVFHSNSWDGSSMGVAALQVVEATRRPSG
jgi:hypothetical protein